MRNAIANVIGWMFVVVAVLTVVAPLNVPAQEKPAQEKPAQEKPAQSAPATKPDTDKEPVLTELQNEKLSRLISDAQLAGQQADAKAIAAAIVALIEARQQAAVKAANEANAYFQTLNVEGWTLDVQTKKYTKKKD